jgi:hypothetical protein
VLIISSILQTPVWKAYFDFVYNIIIEGFVFAITVSLQHVCKFLNPLIITRHEMLPRFDVKIVLGGEIRFEPPSRTRMSSPRPRAPTWEADVDFVNNIIVEGFVSAIAVSLQHICEFLDPFSIARHEMACLPEGKFVFGGRVVHTSDCTPCSVAGLLPLDTTRSWRTPVT